VLAVRIGVVTDVHYADKPATTKRDYRASVAKIEPAVAERHFLFPPRFLICMESGHQKTCTGDVSWACCPKGKFLVVFQGMLTGF